MRNFLFTLFFVLALGPATPASLLAQQPVLAQADTDKEKAGDKEASDEAADEESDDDKASDDETSDDEASDGETSDGETSDDVGEKSADDEASKPSNDATSATPAERVPLQANFSKAEIITASSAYVAGMSLLVFGPDIFGAPDASMGTPQVGSFDYKISSRFHGDLVDPGPFLFGVPDFTGLIAFPTGGTLFYMGSAAYYWMTGDTIFGQSVNIDHSAIGFIEAMGWTALTTATLKLIVGRERPFKALNRPEFGDVEESDANLSFPSGHTSISFVAASYMAADLSDHFEQNGAGWWTGTFIPYLSLYGIASLVGVSRIFDQNHYTSDVLVGALIGGLIGNLTYHAHFDEDGNPEVHHPEFLEDVDVSVGPIVTPSGAQGVGLLGSW